MATNEMVLYDPVRAQVDQFFAAKPAETDWIEKLQLARDGKLDADALLLAIKAREPMTPGSPYEHEVWVNQQLLRLAMRQKANQPLIDYTCGCCGSRMRDPVLETCLWCAEREFHLHYLGSRGSCYYIRPVFDPRTDTWGILFYDRNDGDNRVMLWLAKGFARLEEAEMALYPISVYSVWLAKRYNGVYNDCYLVQRLFPLEVIIDLRTKLPFAPADFTAHLKNTIFEHMQMDHNLIAWATRRGLDEYHRNETH